MLGWRKHKLELRVTRRNINHLRYADDTTLMAESEEELKNLLMKVKEESEKVFVTPWTVACQAPLSTGILQARILERVAFPSSRGIFPTQG